MEKYSVFVPKLLKKDEKFVSARRSCKGCGKALGIRIAAKAIAETNSSLLDSSTELSRIVSSGFKWNETSFSSIAEFLLKSIDKEKSEGGLSSSGKKQKPVIAIDFSVFKQNLVSFQSIIEKRKNLLILFYDNESYMDDIIENFRPLPFGVDYHHETPGRKEISFALETKNIFHIADNLSLSYAASASASYPFDLIEKVKKGVSIKGTAVIHLHSPCPTGWMFPEQDTVKTGILAVESGFHPLWEYIDKTFVWRKEKPNRERLKEYIGFQKRYRYVPDNFINMLSEDIQKEAESLNRLCAN